MLLGKYSISSHAIEQYQDRASYIHGGDVVKSIRRDLRTMNIRKIDYKKDGSIHVYTFGFKEFVFIKTKSKRLLLRTFIRRNHVDHQKRMETVAARA